MGFRSGAAWELRRLGYESDDDGVAEEETEERSGDEGEEFSGILGRDSEGDGKAREDPWEGEEEEGKF